MSEDLPLPPQFERVPVFCQVDDLQTEGEVRRRDLPQPERLRRSLRSFGICFLIAFFTVFIPILHFILPPLLLIIGMVFAATTWMETSEIGGGEITCPNCKKQMLLRRAAEEWPQSLRCEGCSYTLTVKKCSDSPMTR